MLPKFGIFKILKGNANLFNGSKVKAILFNRWILPIVGVASGRVFATAIQIIFHKQLSGQDVLITQ